MKTCTYCKTANPETARYCMTCGQGLPLDAESRPDPPQRAGGMSMLGLSLLGSLLISLVLIYIFKLPIFFLFGFLPLLWRKRKG